MQNQWQAIAISDQIKTDQAYTIWLMNKPWVLFRDTKGKAVLLDDTCPHRFASLSKGKIIQGKIQCPYHGWQFNQEGLCTRVPGLKNLSCEKPILASQAVIENGGLIWASANESEFNVPMPAAADIPQDYFFMQTTVQSDLLTLVENFLDGFHTHFVHAGLIRRDQDRQQLAAEVKPLIDGIEVSYSGETNQNGVLSRWFEPTRGYSYARFRLPNFSEIEYRGKQGQLNLLVSLWAAPAQTDQLSIIVRIATQKGFWPAWLKQWVLKKLFRKIQQQDQQIVEQVFARKKIQADQKPLSTELDLLHPWLQRIIESQQPQEFDPIKIQVSL